MNGNYYQPFSLRIPEELLYKIKMIAKSNKRSSNKEMEYALQKYVERWEKENDPIEEPNKE